MPYAKVLDLAVRAPAPVRGRPGAGRVPGRPEAPRQPPEQGWPPPPAASFAVNGPATTAECRAGQRRQTGELAGPARLGGTHSCLAHSCLALDKPPELGKRGA